MDRNRPEGSWEQAKGGVKEGVGKATGDQKLQSEGRAQKLGGKFQNALGGIADTIRDAVKGRDRR